MRLTISLLGPLEIHSGHAPLHLGGARLRTLLTRLALDPDRTVSTATLIDALWPDTPPDNAANALQSLVSRLRKALGDPALLAATPSGYRLAVAPDAVDTVRFEALFRQGRAALTADDPENARRLLAAALALFRGPALAESADAPFAAAPATRLDELRVAALCDRLDAELRLGLHAEALPELEALTAEHPLRENIAALHIRALSAAGRQAEALAAYDTIRRTLADQLGLDPSPDLARVHLAVLRGEPLHPAPASQSPATVPRDPSPAPQTATATPPAPPLAAPSEPAPDPAPKTNLRPRLTTFVGREDELNRIAKHLDEYRLITLVGPGGAGKTRLAGEAALRNLPRHADGAWLAELAPVTDPAQVPVAVLDALGPRETRVIASASPTASVPRGSALHQLIEHLADKSTLLVLDNCEHLVTAAAELAETLLGHCPGLRIVATSREPLGILGERLYPVPPLSHPTEGPGFGTGILDGTPPAVPALSVEAALAHPAIRLFADRAAAVRPDFAVTPENLADVIAICRRLDGLPLAIELAAARLRTLDAPQIAARLDNRFRLLTGGSRTAMPRHQTLRAVVAWSWELLSDDERDLAERLAVFPGGVTASAAAAVVPGGVPEEVFDLMSALVDKSLLQAVPTADPGLEPRFRMLETLREYGAERLDDRATDSTSPDRSPGSPPADRPAGLLTEVRRAHARYFRDLAETAEPHLRRSDQLIWLSRLNAERDNFTAAMRFAADDGDADTAVRIGAAMAWYWTLSEKNSDAVEWMRTVLAVPGPSDPVAHAVVAVLERVTTLFQGEKWGETDALEQEITGLIAGLDQTAHPLLALVDAMGPMLADDQARLRAAIEKHQNHPDPWVRAMLYLMRGMSDENAGQRATVESDLLAAQRLFTECGDRWGMSGVLNALASLALTEGDDTRALDLQGQALALITDLNALTDAAQIQMMRALILTRTGATAEGLALLQDIVEAGHRSGSETTIFLAHLGLAEHHRLLGDIPTAWHYLLESEQRTDPTWHGPPQILALRDASGVLLSLADDNPTAALTRLRTAWKRGLVSHDMPVQARVAVAAACYTAAIGDLTTAAATLGITERLLGTVDRSDTDRTKLVARLREELEPEVYEAAYAEGRSLSRSAAQVRLAEIVGVPADPRHQARD